MKSRIIMWILSVSLVAGLLSLAQANEEPAAAAQTTLSSNIAEVVRLVDSGVEESVLLDYIRNSPATFQLSADDIIYLRDLGLSSAVISAMIEHQGSMGTAPSTEQASPVAGSFTNVPSTNTDAVSATNANAPVSYTTNATPEVQYFYDALVPYGTWIFIEGQGWAWQPNIVATKRDWQPYRDDGHWVWSDAGWYWASDYSWGWATFHYGRWWLSPQWGWVWFPDTTWAPSWVTWRTYDNYWGWAPLPPTVVFTDSGFRFRHAFVRSDFGFGLKPDCFTFVESRHFFDHDFHRRHVPRHRVHQFFNHCKVINNFAFDPHKRIVNRGVDVNHAAGFTGKRIDTARVIDAPKDSARFHHPGRIVKGGRIVEVVRTQLPSTPPTGKTFIAQKADPRKAIVPNVPERLQSAFPNAESQQTVTRAPATKAESPNPRPEFRGHMQNSAQTPGSPMGRPSHARPDEREGRHVLPAAPSPRMETARPQTTPQIRERAGTPIVTQPKVERGIQPPATPPKATAPPAQNPPVQPFHQPVERFNQPVERFDQPVERFHQPVQPFNQRVERINPPVERISPPVQRPPISPIPLHSIPHRIESPPTVRQGPVVPQHFQGAPPSLPQQSSGERTRH